MNALKLFLFVFLSVMFVYGILFFTAAVKTKNETTISSIQQDTIQTKSTVSSIVTIPSYRRITDTAKTRPSTIKMPKSDEE